MSVRIESMSKYCVICKKTWGPHMSKCCTYNSIVAVRKGRFTRTAKYYDLKGTPLTESDLHKLEDRENSILTKQQRASKNRTETSKSERKVYSEVIATKKPTTSTIKTEKNRNQQTNYENTDNKHSGDNTYNEYYKYSGKVPLKGVVYVFILGTLLTIAIFFMYCLALGFGMFLVNKGWKIARVVIFLVPIYGAVVGWIVTKCCKIGKVRNTTLCTLFGLLFGIFAAYVDATYFLSGSGLLYQLKAIVIIGASTATSWLTFISAPFCERCNRWIEEKDLVSPLEFLSKGLEVKSKLEHGVYSDLIRLKRVDTEASAYTEIELRQCRSCRQLSLLSVTCIGVKGKDKYGNKKTIHVPIVCDLIIPVESYNILIKHW